MKVEKVEDVRRLPWINVTDWGNLVLDNDESLTESSVNNFLVYVFSKVARELEIPINVLLPILKEENQSFYETKRGMFEFMFGAYRYKVNDKRYQSLKKLLYIPDVSKVSELYSNDPVKKLMSDFSQLTDVQKLEVLQEMKFYSVKVESSKE